MAFSIQIGCLVFAVGLIWVGMQGLTARPNAQGHSPNRWISIACIVASLALVLFAMLVLPRFSS